jgi:hypothetical protein
MLGKNLYTEKALEQNAQRCERTNICSSVSGLQLPIRPIRRNEKGVEMRYHPHAWKLNLG